MQSLSFTPGRAFLSSNSPTVPWTAVFEDEGVAGYFYACDRSHEKLEDSILDAMLIYNVEALAKSDAEFNRPEPQRIVAIAHELTPKTRPALVSGAIDVLISQDAGHEVRLAGTAVRVIRRRELIARIHD